MNTPAWHHRVLQQPALNFVLTNRLPRALLTRFMGWFSRIERPLVRDLSIAVWRLFADLDLADAKKARFSSLHDCFTRELRPGARVVDPDPNVLASPVDAIVGACGPVQGTQVFQAKGSAYTLAELFVSDEHAALYRDGCYATLRLTSSMFHRFHAPYDCHVDRVTYIAGDAWNVNPPALARIERLFCKNERALIHARLAGGPPIMLVPVAAILVASIRLQFVDVRLHLKYRGPNRIDCDARLTKGQEMGWFEHGSTLIVFAPRGFRLCEGIEPGAVIRMGRRLMHLPSH
jgi:phosphatidylserine decarboxylase